MNIDEEILKIERERLKMEKIRDKHTRSRFIIGGIIIAFATSALSLFLDHQQSERAFANSEKQMLIPMIYNSDPSDFDGRLKKIKDFLEGGDLYKSNIYYLKGQQKVIHQKKAEFERLENKRIVEEKKAKEAITQARLIKDKEAKTLANLKVKEAKERIKAIQLKQSNLVGFRILNERNEPGVLY